MAPDVVTEVTKQSWLSRIGGSFKGVAFGALLVIAAIPLLFWNEGRAVERQKTLEEGGGAVISVASDAIDSSNEGALVHVSGTADSDAMLVDPVFGVSAEALKLRRTVEMYQWQETASSETKDKLGGGQETVTTYTYSLGWSERVIDSSGFKEPTGHQNPDSMPYESGETVAEPVTLGDFTLSPSLVRAIGGHAPLDLPEDVPAPVGLGAAMVKQQNGFYIGGDPASPQVGDLRVSFAAVMPTEVSVIAQQTGGTFAPYRGEAGGTIELIVPGVKTAEEMILAAEESNRLLTWILRVAGFLIAFVGLTTVLRPLSVLADVVPVIGRVVGAGTGFIALLLAAALSLTVGSIAWVFYRPVVGLAILAAVAAIVAAVVVLLRKAKRPEVQPAPA